MHLIDIYNLEYIHKMLRDVLENIEKKLGPQIITSQYRLGDDGVHGTLPLRATDLRCRDTEYGAFLVDWVNKRWQYDPYRPEMVVAVAHGQGYNYHIHLQVHDNTVRR